MISELFVNAAILLASISIGNQILINKELTPSSSLRVKIFFGLGSAVLGIILMIYSIDISPNIIMDLRNIAIMLSATYCGLISAILTGLILSIFRLFFQGLTFPSIMASANLIAITISSGITTRYVKNKPLQWIIMAIYALIFPTITFIFVINNQNLLIETIFAYWISTIIASIVVYIFIKYIDILRFSYQRYQHDSYKDYRTGLSNVRQFDQKINNLIKNSTESSIVSLLFIDIDYFKRVNDAYGHQNGDLVLEDLGKILLNSTDSNDIVSRNGGEEFSVIMTDCPRDKVMDVAERIRKAVQEHKFLLLNGKLISITVSIGAAIYPHSVNKIEDLVEKADSALYKAKKTGRNRVCI